MWEEEAASGAEIVEEKEFLFPTDLPVVPTRCFGEELLVLNHLLLVGE